jgi:tetratricopeptide (TPR) repeat protein
LGERHVTIGKLWFALSQNSFLAGNLDAAQAEIEKALVIERHVLEPDSRILADAYSMQGQIFHGQGKLAQARASLDSAISIYRKAFGGPHYLIGIAQVYLALVESDLGRVNPALKTLDDAKRNYDASYGGLHPNHGDLLVNRATILAKAGRVTEAHKDCAAGLDILGRTLGAKANYTIAMAQTCASLGR